MNAIRAIRDYSVAVKAQGIVLCDEERLLWLAQNQEQLEGACKLLVSPLETLNFLYSKRCQIQLAAQVGFRVLPTAYVLGRSDVDRIPASLYPVIIRPDDKWKFSLPFKCGVAYSAAELHKLLERFHQDGAALVVQPFYNWPNLVVHGARTADGKILTLTAFLVERKFQGMTLTITPTACPPDVKECCRKFAHACGVVGCFHYELLYSPRGGRAYFLELNPRLGGTTDKVTALGFDETHYLLSAFELLPSPAAQPLRRRIAANKGVLLKHFVFGLKGNLTALDYPGKQVARQAAVIVRDLFRTKDSTLDWRDVRGSLWIHLGARRRSRVRSPLPLLATPKALPVSTRAEPLQNGLQWRSRLSGSKAVDRTWDLFLPYLLILAHSRLPVVLWQGPTRPTGRPAALLSAGKEPWIDHLPKRFFSGEPQRRLLANVPVWDLARRLQQWENEVDLIVIRANRISARLCFDSNYLSVPEWVGATLTTPAEPEKLTRLNSDIAEDMRRVRRGRFEPVLSHEESDFDAFYRTMYVPFIRQRHGSAAVFRNPYLLKRGFHRGGLLWLNRDGRRVAGAVFELRGDTLVWLGIGTADGDPALLKDGATAALYYHVIMHAHRSGCARIDFGTSRSSIHDGVLRYKRKWGITLDERPYSRFDLLVRWKRLDGVVADFLSHTSLIFRDHGGLSAVHALPASQSATADDAARARHYLWTGGMRRLYLVHPNGWSPGTEAPLHTTLVDGRTSPDWRTWEPRSGGRT